MTSLSGTMYQTYEPSQRKTKMRTADLHDTDGIWLLNMGSLSEFPNHFTKFNLACSDTAALDRLEQHGQQQCRRFHYLRLTIKTNSASHPTGTRLRC